MRRTNSTLKYEAERLLWAASPTEQPRGNVAAAPPDFWRPVHRSRHWPCFATGLLGYSHVHRHISACLRFTG